MRTLPELLPLIEANDTNYEERYRLVLEAVARAASVGIPAGFRLDPSEPEWPVAFIQLPTGMVSWHMPQFATPYDGHSTPEKYQRCRDYLSFLNERN